MGIRQLGLSMELQGGTGPITAMCSCGEFLEIYKTDKTFRVQDPDTFDPGATNDNAPWLASPVADVGSSNIIIARVLLQAQEILRGAPIARQVDIEGTLQLLHRCK